MNKPFTVKQACKLIDHPVAHNAEPKPTTIAEIGLIVGLLHLNEEIEVIVKFIDGLKQYTKNEFTRHLRVID
jgi:hypothetical protein